MKLPILLVALFTGAGSGEPPLPTPLPLPTPDSGAESVMRSYNLRAYGGPSTYWKEWLNLFPGSLGMHEGYEAEEIWEFDTDLIENTLISLLAEELEYEGRRFGTDDHARFTLFAPQEVQDRAQAILNVFADTVRTTAQLRVDVVQVAPGQNDVAVGVIDLQAARAILGMQTSGPTSTYHIPLGAFSTSSVYDATRTTFVGDYDVEVAQNAASFDPVILNMVTGTRMLVSASPAREGCNLALTYWYGNSENGPQDVDFSSRGTVTNDSGLEQFDGPGILQTMSVAQRSIALNTMIPDGKALALRTVSSTDSQAPTQIVLLQLEGKLAPTVRTVRLGHEQELHLIRNDALAPPHVYSEGQVRSAAVHHLLLRAPCREDNDWYTVHTHHPEADHARDWLMESMEDMEFDGSEAWMIGYRPDGRQSGDASRLAKLVDAALPTSEVVQVSLRLESGSADGEVVSCELPMRLGTESSVVLGTESSTVFEYDIEIAQGATIHDPNVEIDMDGLMLSIRPSRTADGGIQLRIQGGAQLVQNVNEVRSKNNSFGSLQLKTYDRLLIHQVLYFDGEEGGSAVIGNAAEVLPKGSLRLTVQVH